MFVLLDRELREWIKKEILGLWSFLKTCDTEHVKENKGGEGDAAW